MRENPLSERQLQILQLSDKSAAEIAKILNLQPKTVQNHLDNINSALGVKTTRASIFIGFREGWLK